MKPLHLLLIDDDPFSYLFIREQLSLIGGTRCTLDWQDNFDDGLRVLQEQRHDAYIIDYRLGDRDGLELLRETQSLNQNLAVIILTSAHSQELCLESLELGASGYLAKQEISPSLLERSIRHALRYAQALEALHLAECRYQAVADSGEMGVWEWDHKEQTASFSPRWQTLLGYPAVGLDADLQEWFKRVHKDDQAVLMAELQAHLDGHLPSFRQEHRMQCADGEYRWFLSQGMAVSRSRIAGTMINIHHCKQNEAHAWLAKELRQAMLNDGLSLHYQPIYSLADESVVAVEALLRWDHPEHGMISPAEFIPCAEQCGLIDEVGEWVLKQACADMRHWRDSITGLDHLRVSVNLSPQQFSASQLPQIVQQHLQQAGLPPECLKLEITESALLPDAENVHQQLAVLREYGVNFLIDDFGTGYSSLSYLHQIPGTGLKIDRSFVTDLQPGNKQAAVVQTILSLGKQLGLEVIAEGVETSTQARLLQSMGCERVQGFWYAKPMNPQEIFELLQRSARFNSHPTRARSAA